jgi:hypothetical protein
MGETQQLPAAGLGPVAWTVVGLLVPGSMAAVLVIFISGFMSVRQDYARFDAPGEAALELSKTGKYLVYHEYRRSDDSVGYVRPPGQETLRFQIRPATGESELPVSPPATPESYAIRRTYAEAIGEFQVSTPGAYTIKAVLEQAPEAEPLTLVVRASAREVFSRTLFQGVSLLMLVVVVLVGMVWRANARNV